MPECINRSRRNWIKGRIIAARDNIINIALTSIGQDGNSTIFCSEYKSLGAAVNALDTVINYWDDEKEIDDAPFGNIEGF